MGASSISSAQVFEYPKFWLSKSFVFVVVVGSLSWKKSVSHAGRDRELDVVANVSIFEALLGASIECLVLMYWWCDKTSAFAFCMLICRMHFWSIRCLCVVIALIRQSELGFGTFPMAWICLSAFQVTIANALLWSEHVSISSNSARCGLIKLVSVSKALFCLHAYTSFFARSSLTFSILARASLACRL